MENLAAMGRFGEGAGHHRRVSDARVHISPFVGRIGGNGGDSPPNEEVLKSIPDAVPYMGLKDIFNLQPFFTVGLWKAALLEGMGEYPASHRTHILRLTCKGQEP